MPVMNVAAPLVDRVVTLSPEVMALIENDTLEVHGGVLRYAKGQAYGGRIHSHLKIPSDAVNADEQLKKIERTIGNRLNKVQSSIDSVADGIGDLQQSMDTIQGLQQANLVLAGLNLAVSVAGFAIVCNKLNGISAQIQAQSEGINELLRYAATAEERALLRDHAKFIALVSSAKQFCMTDDVNGMTHLIPRFHEEYHFNLLLLERLSEHRTVSRNDLHNIQTLQSRLVNLGMLLAHVQLRMGAASSALDSVNHLSASLTKLNANRVHALTSDRDEASRITMEHFEEIKKLLDLGKKTQPALAYEASLLELEISNPGLLLSAQESDEIQLLLAA